MKTVYLQFCSKPIYPWKVNIICQNTLGLIIISIPKCALRLDLVVYADLEIDAYSGQSIMFCDRVHNLSCFSQVVPTRQETSIRWHLRIWGWEDVFRPKWMFSGRLVRFRLSINVLLTSRLWSHVIQASFLRPWRNLRLENLHKCPYWSFLMTPVTVVLSIGLLVLKALWCGD